MKNRRLNILFIALIALAAAPQAMHDLRSLANAAQERAESEFWSVFLSYQSADGNGAGRGGARGTEMIAAHTQTRSACPIQQGAESQPEVVREPKQVAQPETRTRSNAEGKRTSARADASAPEADDAEVDDSEAVASGEGGRPVTVDKEQEALTSASMHARDSERLASVAQKAALASFMQEKGDVQIKFRQLLEIDKALRQKGRSTRECTLDAELPPVPNPGDSM